ncbi:hypothetical protein CVS40_10000, partial [Lucilia cuprina]
FEICFWGDNQQQKPDNKKKILILARTTKLVINSYKDEDYNNYNKSAVLRKFNSFSKMNLVMASVLLLAMLAFQPTLIYGTKNLASARNGGGSSSRLTSSLNNNNNRNIRSSKYGKRHSTEPLYSPALSPTAAKLVMSLESGDVLVRSARGAATDQNQNLSPANGNNDVNKNLASQEGAAAAAGATPSSSSSTATSSNRRKHLEKKFSAASGLSGNQQQQQKQHPNTNSNNNKGNNNKQRQMLKSQNHQNKRSGGGKQANKENVEKTQSESEKSPTTCRYAKSAWSECDPKTNMRSRILTLKKGEPNCLETRTMQKKCKKTCRYEKGAWSECTNGQMTREDKLKATGGVETSCEAVRSINKKCNPNNGASKQASGGGGSGNGKKERKNKEKGSRRVVKN